MDSINHSTWKLNKTSNYKVGYIVRRRIICEMIEQSPEIEHMPPSVWPIRPGRPLIYDRV